MRIVHSYKVWLSLIFASVCLPFCATCEEWAPVVGRPPLTNCVIETVGGISYFTFAAHVPTCFRIYGGPVTVTGTNLSETVEKQQWTGICEIPTIPDPGHDETHVSVLGALAPGDYSLTLYCRISSFPYPQSLIPFQRLDFTVPNTGVPTFLGSANTNSFILTVQGVANAIYTIQTSTNLTNWQTVGSVTNAPFEWTEPMISGTPQFYRVLISDN